jgi:arylsulfatase A-like enzyme
MPPNIVLILADDMGYGDLSCLNDESKIHTVHMDRVAAEGMCFTDGHASSSVCTPSRYGILTGRYAWRGRLRRSVLWPFARPLIEPDQPTLPGFLRANGYRTACVGKWHLGMDWPFRHRQNTDDVRPGDRERIMALSSDIDYSRPIRNTPLAWGFDEYFGVDVPNFPPYCFIEGDRTVGIPDQPKPDSMFGAPGHMVEGWDLEQIMPALARRAVSVIERQTTDQPFFLYFSLTGPHTPIAPTAEFRGKSDAGIYGDWVLQMDDAVGQVVAALERMDIAGNTILVVASDNGSPGRNGSTEAPGTVIETFGHNPSWILRGMKADTWDGGHRIPFLVRWPGTVVPGRCAELACLLDVFATVADAIGADLPEEAQDSRSLLPLLLGGDNAPPVRNELVHHGLNGLFGLRQGDWKYIAGTGSGGFSPNPPVGLYDPPAQLYNMATDIRERRNLCFERPEVCQRLAMRLAELTAGG